MLKGIIFDFDGVIAESVQVKSDAFAELYKSYGQVIVINVVKHHEANGGMSRFEKMKYYHKTFLNKTITDKEMATLTNQFSNLVIKKVIAAPYVPGALEYIKNCYKQYNLFISTGTPIEEIKQILKSREIAKYFTDVFGSPENKIGHIKKIISKYGLKREELLFFGDSNSDMNAAAFHRVQFVMRLHSLNHEYFGNYTGKTIENFNYLSSNIFQNSLK